MQLFNPRYGWQLCTRDSTSQTWPDTRFRCVQACNLKLNFQKWSSFDKQNLCFFLPPVLCIQTSALASTPAGTLFPIRLCFWNAITRLLSIWRTMASVLLSNVLLWSSVIDCVCVLKTMSSCVCTDSEKCTSLLTLHHVFASFACISSSRHSFSTGPDSVGVDFSLINTNVHKCAEHL